VACLSTPAWTAAEGGQPATDIEQVEAWMPRLVGMFRLEGSVEIPGDAGALNPAPVQGLADCRPIRTQAFGRTPAVECFLEMSWAQTSAAPASHPAVILFAYDLAEIGVRHMLVDDEGVAEAGTARLFNHTLVSTSPCARTRDKCVRSVRIIAEPDLKVVKMTMDMEVAGKRTGGHQFTLYRQGASP
jgi:hypothetical protein